MAVVPPEHIVSVEGVAVATGTGLTVITTAGRLVLHPAGVVAVILYVTVPELVPVVLSVWAMLVVPEPGEAPVTPEDVMVQLKFVPAILLVNGIEVVVPEQIGFEAGKAVTTGFGFTVITTVTGVPGQLLAVGVIV
jgi:hypothetical protein